MVLPTKKPFVSFYQEPNFVDFETKEKEEKVVLFLRKHPVTNLGWISATAGMVIAPVFLSLLTDFSFLPAPFRLIGLLSWYLIVFAFVLENFLIWFFNVNIITDERIIDIDFHNLIYKEVSDAKIDKIQDVTYRVGGAVRALFNYGDVLIQTAGEVQNFEFLAVPKPAKVAKILQELRTEEEIEKLEGRIR